MEDMEWDMMDIEDICQYVPHQNVGNPRYCSHAPRGYVQVSQKLIISKYCHVAPHFKGNFVRNRNQVVKSSKNQYFGCFYPF